jgi:hypothetical protein
VSSASNSDPDRITPLLQNARLELLDLTARNRLLNTPRRSRRSISLEIVDEIGAEIYRLLVRENRSLSFQSGVQSDSMATSALLEDPEFAAFPQPDSDEVDERGFPKRHSDSKLQTQLTSEALQRRLLTLYRDAQTFIDEQGVNILYLSLGMLRWYEDRNSEIERYAPLFLIPVTLERRSASTRFTLRWTGEEPQSNISLAAKLKSDFGLLVPEAENTDDLDLESYVNHVQKCVSSEPRWEILFVRQILDVS